MPDDGLLNSLALRDKMFEMVERHGLDAIAMQSFRSIQDAVGEGFGLGVSLAEVLTSMARTGKHLCMDVRRSHC